MAASEYFIMCTGPHLLPALCKRTYVAFMHSVLTHSGMFGIVCVKTGANDKISPIDLGHLANERASCSKDFL